MPIRVKFLTKNKQEDVFPGWRKFLPHGSPVVGGCEFLFHRDDPDYDWLVVYDDLPSATGERFTLWEETLKCPRAHTLLVTTEPASIKVYGSAFLKQFGWILTSQEPWVVGHPGAIRCQPGLIRFYEGDHDEILANPPTEKTALISTVCSSKQQKHTLHHLRYEFTQRLKAQLPELEIYGHGVRPIDRKNEALDSYQYHIAIENHIALHHWTEKLADPLIALSLPFYFGAPNAAEYFPKDSFIPIDITRFDQALARIRQAIADNEYEKAPARHSRGPPPRIGTLGHLSPARPPDRRTPSTRHQDKRRQHSQQASHAAQTSSPVHRTDRRTSVYIITDRRDPRVPPIAMNRPPFPQRPWRWPAEWLGWSVPDCGITCPGGGDGMGAQVMARLSTRIFAELKGIRYLHTPLQSLEHTPAGCDATAWASRWEEFLNYAASESPLPDVPVTPAAKAHRLRPLSGHVYSVKHCHKITNHLPDHWHNLRPGLREKYRATPKPAIDENPVLAVHVRRGDVSYQGKNPDRYTPLDQIIARIELALGHLPEPRVKIYSQGSPEDFAAITDRFNAELCLGEDEFTTFHALVGADARVMAKSSFSYLAALIADGVTVYEPFWHPPMPDWISIEPTSR